MFDDVKIEKIAIIGAGGWGTALAALWAKDGREILLWGNNAHRARRLQERRENADYLPGVILPPSVKVTSNLIDCADADLAIFVTPSTALREIAMRFRESTPSSTAVLLSCTKGIEHGTGMRMSQILEEAFPGRRIAVLSGPNLAVEISRELPTATVLGCRDADCARELQQQLGRPRFRIYTSDEITGIELGGALKNVFAITAGVSDGIGLGDNSKAALVTRALAELLRLGTAMGGQARTFYGLSGAGDLVATCFSQHSRNRRVGEELGRGMSLSDVTRAMHTTPEGIPTTKSAYECARRLKIDTPIIDQAYALLYEGKKPLEALEELLKRDQKAEES